MSQYRKQVKPLIAVVDDDAVLLEHVKLILCDQYRVATFSGGEQLLRYLELRRVSLILLDMVMPAMDGEAVLEKIIADPRFCKIPVIIMTGVTDDLVETDMIDLGAVDYIRKPINPKVLLSRVRVFLDIYDYQNRLEELVEEKVQELRAWDDEVLTMLARITDLRDEDTGGHIDRTTEYARIIVEELIGHPQIAGYEMTRETGDIIVRSMKLHDIGKIAIPDAILQKPGKLTESEFEIIKKHAEFGGELFTELSRRLNNMSLIEISRNIAHFHHEKWNGSGYPYGLSGTEIPICARIAAVCDVYDALTSVRAYKPAFPHDKAVGIIMEDAGTHFDPYLASLFSDNHEKFREARVIIDRKHDEEFGTDVFSMMRAEIA